ncbi:hypothetical protein PV328_004219 [Microctonus aethiopoides]|uniref:Uncharacterized protein n=1 Tax=Microctonus aethiopoides TaxID=144406 RepID=A0AA39FA38_9HYME|nr:hypothetical protein PV328_004219 [Microctonus aethiopoides]
MGMNYCFSIKVAFVPSKRIRIMNSFSKLFDRWKVTGYFYISGLKNTSDIPSRKIGAQDDSDDAKLLQGPPTKFVTSYLQPVVCEPLFLHIAHREIFCLCVVKVHIVLTSEANQQNYRSIITLTSLDLEMLWSVLFMIEDLHCKFGLCVECGWVVPVFASDCGETIKIKHIVAQMLLSINFVITTFKLLPQIRDCDLKLANRCLNNLSNGLWLVSSAIERHRSGTLTTSRDVDVVLSADDLGSEHNFTDLTKDVEIDTQKNLIV